MFNKYYQDELAYLRDLGQEYAKARPEAARFLGEAGSDPDVERLLEGFAFLSGRVRQKLDDEIPEFTHAMMELFFPQFLRPVPPIAILQAQPRRDVDSAGVVVDKGTYIDSVKVGDVRCRFRTAVDLQPVPAQIQNVEYSDATPPTLRVEIQAIPGNSLHALEERPLRLYLGGDAALTRVLYLCLCHRLQRVLVGGVHCPDARVMPANLGGDAGLLPTPDGAFSGFRVLQEYFAFPSRFMFVDVSGISFGQAGNSAEIAFVFESAPDEMPPVSAQNLTLNCVPVTNLFDHDADPIRIEPERSEYKIRPAGGAIDHYEVYSVTRVEGREKGSGEIRTFEPFFSFRRTQKSADRTYEVRPVESVSYEGIDHMLSMAGGDDGELVDVDTLSLDLVCSNRRAADQLGVGDIHEPSSTTPLAFTYRNVTRPTTTIAAPIGDDIHWRLLANLSLNYLSLLEVDTLRALLRTYDFRAREDRQAQRLLDNRLDAIESVRGERETLMLEGAPVRGVSVVLEIDEERFGGEGEVFLFGTVFNEFLAQYVTLNSFAKLRIDITKRRDSLSWPARLGSRELL